MSINYVKNNNCNIKLKNAGISNANVTGSLLEGEWFTVTKSFITLHLDSLHIGINFDFVIVHRNLYLYLQWIHTLSKNMCSYRTTVRYVNISVTKITAQQVFMAKTKKLAKNWMPNYLEILVFVWQDDGVGGPNQLC